VSKWSSSPTRRANSATGEPKGDLWKRSRVRWLNGSIKTLATPSRAASSTSRARILRSFPRSNRPSAVRKGLRCPSWWSTAPSGTTGSFRPPLSKEMWSACWAKEGKTGKVPKGLLRGRGHSRVGENRRVVGRRSRRWPAARGSARRQRLPGRRALALNVLPQGCPGRQRRGALSRRPEKRPARLCCRPPRKPRRDRERPGRRPPSFAAAPKSFDCR